MILYRNPFEVQRWSQLWKSRKIWRSSLKLTKHGRFAGHIAQQPKGRSSCEKCTARQSPQDNYPQVHKWVEARALCRPLSGFVLSSIWSWTQRCNYFSIGIRLTASPTKTFTQTVFSLCREGKPPRPRLRRPWRRMMNRCGMALISCSCTPTQSQEKVGNQEQIKSPPLNIRLAHSSSNWWLCVHGAKPNESHIFQSSLDGFALCVYSH